MATNESFIPRADTVSGVEDPDRLLRGGRCVTRTAWHTPRIRISDKQPLQEPSDIDAKGLENFHAVSDGVVSEEHPCNAPDE